MSAKLAMLHSVNPTEIHARRILYFKLVVMWDATAWAFVPLFYLVISHLKQVWQIV